MDFESKEKRKKIQREIILYSIHSWNCWEMELAFCWLTHFLNVDHFTRHSVQPKEHLCVTHVFHGAIKCLYFSNFALALGFPHTQLTDSISFVC